MISIKAHKKRHKASAGNMINAGQTLLWTKSGIN